jgi:hypothetical protein
MLSGMFYLFVWFVFVEFIVHIYIGFLRPAGYFCWTFGYSEEVSVECR